MEATWIVDRARLWRLHKRHPTWGAKRLHKHIDRSLTWVKKWLRRFRGADPDDESILKSRSRARKTSPKKVGPSVIARILSIRDEPPGNLRRTPGPKTILYYLHKDEALQAEGAYLPRSTRTIWQILRQFGRIFQPPKQEREPEERPAPMQVWGIDFKDVSTIPPDPDGRKQHGVECFNVVDHGTSLHLLGAVQENYTTVEAIGAMVAAFRVHGCPRAIRLDRDPRFIGT